MVNGKYLLGIAFVTIILSTVFFVMGAVPVISLITPSDGQTVSVNYVNITLTLTQNESGTARLNWNGTGNESMIGSGTSFYKNKTSLTNGQYSYIVYANDSTSGNWTSSQRTVTVNVPTSFPILSNRNPTSPVNSIFNSSVNFNVTVDQTANVSWKIESTEVQNTSVLAGGKSGYLSNATQPIGTYSVTATAYNANGTSASPITWTWNVIPSQGPPSVSGISYTRGATWINWTWTNPATGNFNHSTVKVNSTPQPNTSKNYFNSTPLAPGSTNTIYLQTVDNSGNINSTVIFKSATTFNTPSGPDVNITQNGVDVVFSQVTGEGNTSIIILPASPGGTYTFQTVGSFYDISSNATLSGSTITVKIPYDPSGGINESTVNLYHLNNISSLWEIVTTFVDVTNHKVWGNVTSLSPFVAAIPPAPIITKSPNQTLVETIGNQPVTFNVSTDQTTNISWYLDNNSVQNNITTGTYIVSAAKGSHNITAVATNTTTFSSSAVYWNLSVRSTTYYSGNRIWDGSKPDDFALTYSWNPMSFSGFYYNAKDNVGNENISITLDGGYLSRTINEGKLVYTTSPEEVRFASSKFGRYQVIGFMADNYFAGYTINTTNNNTRPTTDFVGKSAVSQGQLHKVLIDEDVQRTISVGGTLALKEGYVLRATDIDLNGRSMLLELLKDGNQVDVTPLRADETYVYSKTVGGVEALPLIMIRFDNVFAGREVQSAFMKGLFQISEDATIIKTGNKFRNMEVTSVSSSLIQMKNSGNIGLNKGSTVDVMGDVKIKVADNDSAVRFALSVEKTGNFEVRSTVYKDGTPLEWTPYNFGMNIGKTSIGFYYDLDDGIGSEKLTLDSTVSGRSIPDDTLSYSTSPNEVKFTYTGFGKYQVIGFMADKYFAGYTDKTGVSGSTKIITRPSTDFGDKSTLTNGALHKVLVDDDTQRTISVGSTIALQEGYVLKATDIDLNARQMLISLLKDGNEVDVTPLSAGETYVYTKTVGGTESLPLIMVRFENVFSGREVQSAFLKGIFQISENPTIIKVADQFGQMEVRSVTKDKIEMSNDGSIGVSKNTNNVLMGNLKLKVADNDNLRFYFAVDVTAEMIANQLAISAPTKVMAGDTLNIKVTAGKVAVDNSSLKLDTDIGITDKNGELNYTIPRTLKPGTYNITATKTGYEKATKNIEIEKYVDYRLSIEMPSNANQYETIIIKVLFNGTAMSGASVLFDNTSIGTTDSNGEVSYRLETSGTHSVTASKTSYITVSRDIDIRAPYSEFKGLDINVSPNPVFTGDNFVIRSNITNVGTKSDTLPVDLIINGTVVDNRTITIGPNEKVEINFTRQEPLVTNVTVDIMGQNVLLEVQKKPISYLWIAAIATVIGAVIIYVLTSKGLLSLEILKQKFEVLSDKIGNLFKR